MATNAVTTAAVAVIRSDVNAAKYRLTASLRASVSPFEARGAGLRSWRPDRASVDMSETHASPTNKATSGRCSREPPTSSNAIRPAKPHCMPTMIKKPVTREDENTNDASPRKASLIAGTAQRIVYIPPPRAPHEKAVKFD